MRDGPGILRAPQRLLMIAALFAPLLGAQAGGAGDRCAPWPGEPAPLPRIGDADPVRARWAELRARELAQRAELAEATASVESHRIWLRVLCLDPENDRARRGLLRTHPVRVHRPAVRWGEPAEVTADPWSGLASPIRVARPRPSAAEQARTRQLAERRRALAAVEALLLESEASLREARFENALEQARAGRRHLDEIGAGADAGTLRSRLEVLAATVHVALGDDVEARASFGRALAAEPGLALDPQRTSPKVLREFEAARAEAGASP